MRVILLAACLAAAGLTGARASDLGPLEPFEGRLADGSRALVYFTPTDQGLRVVTSWRSDDSDARHEMRFVVTLGPGQSASVSLPGYVDQPSPALLLLRVGDRLRVTRGE